MRNGIIGFFIAIVLVAIAGFFIQQRLIRAVEPDLFFEFNTSVFSTTDFPKGGFVTGRMVHRYLFPARFTVTFYDAQYNEVATAQKPGRYGAVVRMNFWGNEVIRYITLYRTPGKIFWGQVPWPMTVQLPDVGIDPNILRNQEGEIGAVMKSGFVDPHDNVSTKMAVLLAGLSEMQPGDPPADYHTNVLARDMDWWYGLRHHIGLAESYRRIVELPKEYDADPNKKWPLVLYMIGRGEFGTDMNLARQSALCRKVGDGVQTIPAILVAPQPPYDEEWNPRVLGDLLDEMSAKYRIDPDRIYVTGGYGTWDVAINFPDRIAAILPIRCLSNPIDAPRLKNMPIWVFHDTYQDTPFEHVPVSMTTDMIDAIRKAGGHPHMTITDGWQDIWEVPYSTDAPLNWLFAQKRGQPETVAPSVPTS
jgi:hypothetical protein